MPVIISTDICQPFAPGWKKQPFTLFGDVKVRVGVEEIEEPLVGEPGESGCDQCRRRARSIGSWETVASINWSEINDFDLETIVSLLRIVLFWEAPCFLL